MARVDVLNVCGADDGLVHIDYAYDDVSLLITEVSLHNDSQGVGTLSADFYDDAGLNTLSRQAFLNAGRVVTRNISNAGLHMHTVTGARGTSLVPPGSLACSWTPGR
jgi:hypothetical protein